MALEVTAPTALVTALALAREHGTAAEALRLTGLDLDDLQRFAGVPDDVGSVLEGRTGAESLAEALALGFLAGRVAHRPRPRRRFDPTSFLMDRDLLVESAEGESILRLPWFQEDLFVGHHVPDIAEMPLPVRTLATASYRAALAGERGRFVFTSYGHTYTVESVPVHGEEGHIQGVAGVAAPALPPTGRLRAALAHERAAYAMEESARLAEYHAELYRLAGQPRAEERELEAAARAREAARQGRANAFRMRSNGPWNPGDSTADA